jgi:hypothetical protein
MEPCFTRCISPGWRMLYRYASSLARGGYFPVQRWRARVTPGLDECAHHIHADRADGEPSTAERMLAAPPGPLHPNLASPPP